ncbi:sugar phosphate isomerase/epimerase family protein [Cohnella sp. GCM10027633]|uniref:sugar phosphate isomerase/epimerase family protein n=1 Tax=unclassified Cohnella TaxID=2636738 RepID=UPI00363FDF09
MRREAWPERPKLGLIGIVTEEAKKDFWGTMRQLADIGYEGVEAPDGLPEGDVAANVRRFNELGLAVATHSASRERLASELDEVAREALALRTSHVTVWWAPCSSKEETLRDAELFDAAGRRLAREGLRLCYHPHAHEFENRFEGIRALDWMASHTDPEALSFRLDIGWITIAGADPAAELTKLGARVKGLHLKDVRTMDPAGDWTVLGTGIVPLDRSLKAAYDIGGIEWMTVEQDRLRNLTPMETAQAAYLNLKEAGWLRKGDRRLEA